MSIFEYTNTFFKTFPYPFLPKKDQEKLQQKHLQSFLKFARENSDYYSNRIPKDLNLEKVEPINKKDFIKNFNQIVTDKTVTIEKALEAIKNNDNDGAILSDKYSVTMTSGSTGNPTIIIQDEYFQNITSLVGFFRSLKAKFPIILLGETGGYGIEASMIKQNVNKTKLVNKLVIQINVEDPIDSIIDALKKAGPGTIIGYTSVMTILSNKLIDSGIKLKEKQIFLSAEKCSDFDKEIIKKAFNCESVKSIYGCTEAGQIAFECEYGHHHIASDWVLIEPVDKHNNPVGYNQLSDKILLTNMMNRVQPIIRYEVTDKVVLHKGGSCPCGCKDDWIEIEGRSNDAIYFEIDDKRIEVPSISLLIAMADVNKNGLDKFRNYQIFINKKGHLKFVLDYTKDANKDAVNKEIKEKLDSFFKTYGVNELEYEFVKGIPIKTSRGKRKRIVMLSD